MRPLDVFREGIPACVGTSTLLDRTLHPFIRPLNAIFLSAYYDGRNYTVLTPVVTAPGFGVFECLCAVGATKRHGGVWEHLHPGYRRSFKRQVSPVQAPVN